MTAQPIADLMPARPPLRLVGGTALEAAASPTGPVGPPRLGALGTVANSRAAEQRVRRLLTRWMACAIGVALAVGAAAGFAESSRPVTQPGGRVTVTTGDTLWSIARAHAGDGSTTGEVVTQIIELNELAGSDLEPGQELVLPR
ncbi:MAG: LysM peptidoglycan-binding domain-containing protein [Bowdeniella nasicola]|nr:LysM peptidoglycan-binding domain-containing protein [Bowdeniella nasicola]